MELSSLETQAAKNEIAKAIWGSDENTPATPSLRKELSKFYEYYSKERDILDDYVSEGLSTENELQTAIRSIKSNASTPRNLISQGVSNLQGGALLDCAVRVMLMTECNTKGISFGGLKKFTWEDEETPAEFIDRVYCAILPNAAGAARALINLDNLKVHTLVKRAGIELQGTQKLSDHLTLVCGEGVKILLVFSHQAFLECNLERLRSDREDLGHSTAEALAIPSFFFSPSSKWEKTAPNQRCPHAYAILGSPRQRISTQIEMALAAVIPLNPTINDLPPIVVSGKRKWVEDEDLDKTFVDRHHVLAKLFVGGQPDPGDTRELLRQYPYWGTQLARLLREVEEPTPVTWLERHAERRRSPRHMYKCAMAALVVAAVFGMLATVLAAVQVWISYCAWVEDPSRAMCGARKARPPVV
ncbi:hypothetical protein CPLU01_05488 [Colletotrichum plurivorum]|uniref:Uncharacterized protein n=1 Tax=Colletotrichum plurivorum TaxID=2175906 RepID=A0A8H6NI49_9PEZI|nr:hypothetical protein CPLU01_05488 [Colletotrichum plurivorum]